MQALDEAAAQGVSLWQLILTQKLTDYIKVTMKCLLKQFVM